MPSTVVYHFHYNKDACTLRITFVTGMVYDYKNVPEPKRSNLLEQRKLNNDKA